MFKFKDAEESKLPFSTDFVVALNEDWDVVLYKNKLLLPEVLKELLAQNLEELVKQELLYISLDKLFVAIPSSVTNVDEFWSYLDKANI